MRELYCVSGPNIIVTNAKLQALCGVLLLCRAKIIADGRWNVRAYRLADSRSSKPDARKECRARLMDFHEGKEDWRRGWESNPRIKVLQTSPLPLGYRASVIQYIETVLYFQPGS